MPFDSTPIKEDPVLQRLQKARARLAQGWVQFQEVYQNCPQKMSYCMVGALTFNENLSIGVLDLEGLAAMNLVARALGKQRYDIPIYNDAPGRTHADVLAMMDRAIALCEEKTHAIR